MSRRWSHSKDKDRKTKYSTEGGNVLLHQDPRDLVQSLESGTHVYPPLCENNTTEQRNSLVEKMKIMVHNEGVLHNEVLSTPFIHCVNTRSTHVYTPSIHGVCTASTL